MEALNRFLDRLKRDLYYKMAKDAGYRSRASYKLKQIVDRYRLMKPGHVVVDLGAAPGGWTQVAREYVGGEGFVLSVDSARIEGFPWRNVLTIQIDVLEPGAINLIKKSLPRKADIILSDLSPKISGVWDVDHANQIKLSRRALEIAEEVLKVNGSAVLKVFQGSMFNIFLKEVKNLFENVKLVKPPASRARSSEIYLVATGFRKARLINP